MTSYHGGVQHAYRRAVGKHGGALLCNVNGYVANYHEDEYSMSDAGAGTENEEYEEDDDYLMRINDLMCRPDRPDCVPTIDLSWAHADDRTRTPRDHHVTGDHVTPIMRRHVTANDALLCFREAAGHDRPPPVVVNQRRRRRRRRARVHKMKRYTNHCDDEPLTPTTPRREIVHQLDNDQASVESGVQMKGDEINRETRSSRDDDSPKHDVISARDVTVSNESIAGVQCDVTSSVTNMAAYVRRTCETKSSNDDVDADCISPPTPTNTQRLSAERCDTTGGCDMTAVARKLEYESSPESVVERLLCALDCCGCCRLALSVYRFAGSRQHTE